MEYFAIGISIISALFAFWSWLEARKANTISKHPMQIEIYDAFNELFLYMNINGTSLEMQNIAKFYKFSEKSEFYFDNKFAIQINEYFNLCRELSDLNRKYLRDKDDDEKIDKITQEQDILLNKEQQYAKEIQKKFKNILKV